MNMRPIGDANPSRKPEVRGKMSAALKGKPRNMWTAEELSTLPTLYPTAPVPTIIENFPRHSWGSIKAKAHELGITKKWTDREVLILRNTFSLFSKRQIEALLPRRSWIGISKKSGYLGLQRNPTSVGVERRIHRNHRRLTSETIAQISEFYSKGVSKRHIAGELNIGVSTVDFYTRPGARERTNQNRRQRRQRDTTPQKRRTVSTLAINVNGKEVVLQGLHKRERPDVCELCERSFRLSYHHWRDDPNIGMWICAPCHQVATNIEAGFSDHYNKLKALIETEATKWEEQFIARLM